MGETTTSGNAPVADDADAALSSVRLSDIGLRREPPRPQDDRQPGYEALFDYDTLFYDVFRSEDGRQVVCLGPPFLNCERAVAGAEFHVPGATSPLAREYREPRAYLQPNCRLLLSGPEVSTASRVIMNLAGREVEISVRASGLARFAGRRVLTTASRDNPLAWIRDWAEFNVRVHGVDAIIIYDNGSTAYGSADIRDALRGIDGLADLLVVPWLFPFGPSVGPRNVQDSYYSNPGRLEHARRRYCPTARAVLNTDVDELVVTPPGGSIFERVERSGRAAIVFSGIWVEATTPPPIPTIRHADCVYGRRRQALWRKLGRFDRLLRTKWIAVPKQCNDDVEWGVHDVYPASARARSEEAKWKVRPRNILYRHFQQITIGSVERRKVIRRYSPLRHIYDRELAAAFAVAFPRDQVRHRADGWLRKLRLRTPRG